MIKTKYDKRQASDDSDVPMPGPVDDRILQLENELKDVLHYVRVLESENRLLKKITHSRMNNQQEYISTLEIYMEHVHFQKTENTALKEEVIEKQKYSSSLEMRIDTLRTENSMLRERSLLRYQ